MLSPKEPDQNNWLNVPAHAVLQLQRLFILLFLLLFGWTLYLQGVQGEAYDNGPGNPRSAAASAARAKITDRNGKVLAESVRIEAGRYERHYPMGAAAAPVTGYSTAVHGNSGTEAVWNTVLSTGDDALHWLGPVVPRADRTEASLRLTVDAKLQRLAYQLLGSRRGAIVLLEPATGAILAMASTPSVDPEMIDPQWNALSGRQDAPLLNRAAEGLYPPGSSMKVLVALGAMQQLHWQSEQEVADCRGFLQIGAYKLEDAKAGGHGKITLARALAESCNVSFGTIGMKLGGRGMDKLFSQTPWQKTDSLSLTLSKPHYPDFTSLPDGELAQTAIGQGMLTMTPLHMATLAAAVANGGVMMKPYLAAAIVEPQGERRLLMPEAWGTIASAAEAKAVGKMMRLAVEEGTAGAAAIRGASVAGKTGTAENAAGKTHAWFIGFAPFDNPTVAVAVIVENGGGGGDVAAPLASRMLQEVLN